MAGPRGVTPARVALAWLLSKQGVVAPIVGATRSQQLSDAVAAIGLKLTKEEVTRLESPYRPHPVRGHH